MRHAAVRQRTTDASPTESVVAGSAPRDDVQRVARDPLRDEALALGRFIVRQPIGDEFVERYVAAHRHLPLQSDDPRERAVVAFAVAHPLALPCMEAAVALLRPHSLLHRKAILMTAILEASPTYADEFLPRRTGWPALVWLAARVGVTTAAQVAIGLPLVIAAGARA